MASLLKDKSTKLHSVQLFEFLALVLKDKEAASFKVKGPLYSSHLCFRPPEYLTYITGAGSVTCETMYICRLTVLITNLYNVHAPD